MRCGLVQCGAWHDVGAWAKRTRHDQRVRVGMWYAGNRIEGMKEDGADCKRRCVLRIYVVFVLWGSEMLIVC